MMDGSKFLNDGSSDTPAASTGDATMDKAAQTLNGIMDIQVTQRDTLIGSLKGPKPQSFETYVGIGNSGGEVFKRHVNGDGLKIDIGLLTVAAPPAQFHISGGATNLHADSQGYVSSFLGVAVEKNLSSSTAVMAYAGQDYLSGGQTAGMRVNYELDPHMKLSGDIHHGKGLTTASIFTDWHATTEGGVKEGFKTGISLRNGDPVLSASYTAEKKFDLEDNGYLRGQFSASAAKGPDGTKASVGVGVTKDVGTVTVGGVPLVGELGLGVEKTTGRSPKVMIKYSVDFK